MKKHDFVAVIGIAAVSIAGYLAYPAIQQRLDPNRPFLTACENALKERLKAPSTYKRIKKPLVTVKEVTVEEAMPVHPAEADNDDLREIRESLRYVYRQQGSFQHTAFIWYESSNSFGAPIAGLSTCDYYSYKMSPPASDDLRFDAVKIDGQTNSDRLLEAVEAFIR